MIAAVPQVRWKLHLTGRSEELQALAKMFGPRDGPPRVQVWFEGERCYLHAPEFEAMVDARAVLERGEVLVGRLNGLAFLKFGSFRPVETGTLVEPTPAGGGGNILIPTQPMVLHVPTTTLLAYLDYTPNRPPAMNAVVGPIVAGLPPTEEWVGVPDDCAPDVDDALDLLTVGARSNDWRVLYLVYEIIEAHVGQPSKIQQLGWATVDEIRRFKETANSRRVLGTKARHGHRKSRTPKRPMTPRAARELVHRLLLAWMRSQAVGSTRPPRR